MIKIFEAFAGSYFKYPNIAIHFRFSRFILAKIMRMVKVWM